MRKLMLVVLLLAGCPSPHKPAAPVGTQVVVSNTLEAPVTVYVSFGATSTIKADDWKNFCKVTSALNCYFELAERGSRDLPNPKGAYLNMTVSFGSQGCGATKAEVNINNPSWYDVLDISLVDGYSNNVQMRFTPPEGSAVMLGPPNGKDGNETVFGLYPYGCDICTAREAPPCGIHAGGGGCKAGAHYDPKPPCQWQGPIKGGGGRVDIELVGDRT